MPLLSSKPLDDSKEAPFQAALELLDKHHLDGHDFVCGSTLTVADISLLASLSFAEAAQYNLTPYANISRWLNHLKRTLPYYDEVNGEAMKRFTDYLSAKKEKTTESQ